MMACVHALWDGGLQWKMAMAQAVLIYTLHYYIEH